MNHSRFRLRSSVMTMATVVATAAAVLVGSPAHAAVSGTVVRQPAAQGDTVYAIQVNVLYERNAPTTQWRIEFDLPATSQVLPWSDLGWARSGNHWIGTFFAASPMRAGTRYTAFLLVYGLADPTNCLLDGIPCTYIVLTDTEPPTTPANVVATRATYPAYGTSVVLRWSPSTDNFGVTGYEISVNGQVVNTTTNTLYILANPSATTTYAVRAFDRVGNYSGYGIFVLPPA